MLRRQVRCCGVVATASASHAADPGSNPRCCMFVCMYGCLCSVSLIWLSVCVMVAQDVKKKSVSVKKSAARQKKIIFFLLKISICTAYTWSRIILGRMISRTNLT